MASSSSLSSSSSFHDPFDPISKLYNNIINSNDNNTTINNIINIVIIFAITWSIIEILFFLTLRFLVYPKLQALRKTQPYDRDPLELTMIILNLIDFVNDSYSFQKFASGFFCGAKFDDIYKGNYRSFLAWAMYNSKHELLKSDEKENVEIIINEAIRRHNLNNVKEGYNHKVRHVSMTLDPVPYIHRPLSMYVFTGILEIIANLLFLRLKGFHCYEIKGTKYWYRRGPITSSRAPILMLHGICSGWLFYSQLITCLSSERPIILVEIDAIKIKSMQFDMPTPKNFSSAVMDILKRHNFSQVSIVGHSFGSITAGWFVKAYPEAVSHVTLLDPVSLLLCFPDVAYNFIYRPPQTFMQYLIYFFASRELTISHTLHRLFFWYNNIILLEEIPSNIGVLIGVGGADEILNATSIYEYSEKCAIKRKEAAKGNKLIDSEAAEIITHFWPTYSHAEILVRTDAQSSLLAAMNQNEKAFRKV